MNIFANVLACPHNCAACATSGPSKCDTCKIPGFVLNSNKDCLRESNFTNMILLLNEYHFEQLFLKYSVFTNIEINF